MTTKQLEVTAFGLRHSANLVPEFDGGEMGIGQRSGRIIVERLPKLNMFRTRHPRDVIGWRLVCRCARLPMKDKAIWLWQDDQFWSRVPLASEHDPADFRVFAPDELTVDVTDVDDVSTAVALRWQHRHISDWAAFARITAAISDLTAAEKEYDAAIHEAKSTGLIDPAVRSAMGLSADWAEFLGDVLTESENG